MKVPASIPAGRFKSTCLKLMDEVQTTGRGIVVTKRGRPIVRVEPIRERVEKGSPLKGTLSFRREEDLFSAAVVWNAQR